MEGNPYSKFWDSFGDSSGGVIARHGEVTGIDPLEVNVISNGSGITVSGEELMRNGDYTPAAGDMVLLLTKDDQLFYIICKVVSA